MPHAGAANFFLSTQWQLQWPAKGPLESQYLLRCCCSLRLLPALSGLNPVLWQRAAAGELPTALVPVASFEWWSRWVAQHQTWEPLVREPCTWRALRQLDASASRWTRYDVRLPNGRVMATSICTARPHASAWMCTSHQQFDAVASRSPVCPLRG